jgi:Ser/Thr protein kinase RdoA (MazF antagonist)
MAETTQPERVLRYWQERTGPVTGIDAIRQGQEDEVTAFAVMTRNGEQVVLKDIASSLNAQRVETEYNLLRYLHAHNVPVAVPIPLDDGRLYARDQEALFVLYPYLPVDDSILYMDINRVYANIGAAVARLHKALATYPHQIDSWTMNLPYTVFQECVPRILSALSEHANTFRHLFVTLQDEMSKALQDLPTQLIHGDCHGGNYLIYRGDVSGFIDLDHLPTGPRVYDIGYLLADMAKARFFDNHAHAHWLDSFHHIVAGYQQESSLSRHELNSLWYVMLATQVLFVDWFFQHDGRDLALKNLEAFHWILRRKNHITSYLNRLDR